MAAIPCGVSLGTALANTSSGSSRASVCDDSCGSSLCARSRADSLKKTVLSRNPLRIASSTRCMPSTATSPC